VYDVHRVSAVALDMTVIRNFHDASYPMYLRQYLPQAVVVRDVQEELNKQARSRPNLTAMMKNGWPSLLPPLPAELRARGLLIQELWLEPGDDDTAHLGEIYTVLAAHHFKVPAIITDDGDGKNLASSQEFSIPVIDTGELVCEMVCQKKLHREHAWAIYRKANMYPERSEFEALLEQVRLAAPFA
jgi:hypothetical protein